jgi:hypothetical protein
MNFNKMDKNEMKQNTDIIQLANYDCCDGGKYHIGIKNCLTNK